MHENLANWWWCSWTLYQYVHMYVCIYVYRVMCVCSSIVCCRGLLWMRRHKLNFLVEIFEIRVNTTTEAHTGTYTYISILVHIANRKYFSLSYLSNNYTYCLCHGVFKWYHAVSAFWRFVCRQNIPTVS